MAPLNSCFRASMYSASSPVCNGSGLCSKGFSFENDMTEKNIFIQNITHSQDVKPEL